MREGECFSKRVDLNTTYKEFYERYKMLIGSATAQQILNKNNEAWKSFFKLLKLKKECKLPQFIAKVNPPGYKKKNSKKSLWTLLRKDQYRIEGDKIVLKGLGAIVRIELRYKGLIQERTGQIGDTLRSRQEEVVYTYPLRFQKRQLEENGPMFQDNRRAVLSRASILA